MPARVHLFIPCYIDQLFPEIGIATVNILNACDCRLFYPEAQTCCGQPAFNTGYTREACQLAERFVSIFKRADYVVAPSGSCISMVKVLYEELALCDEIHRVWKDWRSHVFELTEFLTTILRIKHWKGYFPARVTYHDSCHLLRELHVQDSPRDLLKSIEGLELVEMRHADICCGFGGTFSVKYPGISTAMAENKVDWIREAGAEYVVAGDASCLMHLDGFLKKQQIPVKTIHLAQLLWMARENLRNR